MGGTEGTPLLALGNSAVAPRSQGELEEQGDPASGQRRRLHPVREVPHGGGGAAGVVGSTRKRGDSDSCCEPPNTWSSTGNSQHP